MRGGLRIRRYNACGGLGALSSHGRDAALAPSQILAPHARVRACELKRILPKTHVLASSSTCADLKQRRWAIDGASHRYHSQHARHRTRHHPTTQPGNQHRQVGIITALTHTTQNSENSKSSAGWRPIPRRVPPEGSVDPAAPASIYPVSRLGWGGLRRHQPAEGGRHGHG